MNNNTRSLTIPVRHGSCYIGFYIGSQALPLVSIFDATKFIFARHGVTNEGARMAFGGARDARAIIASARPRARGCHQFSTCANLPPTCAIFWTRRARWVSKPPTTHGV
eukprot:8967955-Lingulodinium_polyedra.AAC.1